MEVEKKKNVLRATGLISIVLVSGMSVLVTLGLIVRPVYQEWRCDNVRETWSDILMCDRTYGCTTPLEKRYDVRDELARCGREGEDL